MNIIFVRHGESAYNAGMVKDESGDPPLTEKGKKQAEAVGKRLKKYKISEVYTSHLERSRKTGEIISEIIGVPIKESLEEIAEYPSSHLRNRFKAKFDRKTTNREKKLRKFLDMIARERNEDKTVLIVAHGITNRMIMAHLLGIKLNRKVLRFTQHNTCINILSWKSQFNNWNAFCINGINHLSEKLKSEKDLR